MHLMFYKFLYCKGRHTVSIMFCKQKMQFVFIFMETTSLFLHLHNKASLMGGRWLERHASSESNPHSVFGDFLNGKKLVCDSNPHLSFHRPLPTGWVNNIECYRCVKIRRYAWSWWVIPVPWSGSFSTSVRSLVWARIAIQLWVIDGESDE